MTEIRYCVGGPYDKPCISHGQHRDGCDVEKCKGCAPRLATEGHLCSSCDVRFRQWLDVGTVTKTPEGLAIDGHVPSCTNPGCPGCEYKPNSVLWVHWWLGVAQSARVRRSPRWGEMVKGSSDDLPSPLSEAILDCRATLEARIAAIEEHVREDIDHEVPAHMPVYRFAEAVPYLASRLLRIEDHADIMRAVWEDLQDSMVTAHMLAPWRAGMSRIHGVPCPHCERMALVIHGGDDFGTCQHCKCVVASKRFDQWAAMVNYERESA